MSSEGENPSQTPMDHQVDKSVKTPNPPNERYEPVGEGKAPIATGRQPLSDTAPSKLTSWTMAEIERMVSNSVLRTPSGKLDGFAVGLNQRSDFRLRGIAKQLKILLKRDHQNEINSGPTSTRVRDFDIQSQTLRMVTSNAALGTYQFQKNLVLPFMRKQLALGYQKVTLLKEIVSGIGGLEKAIVSKLEAIKMNTAATAPKHKTWFQKLKSDISDKNRQRIAQNFSNLTMDAWSRRYNKFVSPLALKLHDAMKTGGVNKVRLKVTGKLNSLRRKANEFVDDQSNLEEPDDTRLGRAKVKGAKIASKVLGGAVKVGQSLKLSDRINKAAGWFLSDYTEDYARLNPFAAPGMHRINVDEDGNVIKEPTETLDIGEKYRYPEAAIGRLAESFDEWRTEYRSDTDTVIGHLSSISNTLANCCESNGLVTGGPKTKKKSSSQQPKNTQTVDPQTPTRSSVLSAPKDVIPPKSKSITEKLTSSIDSVKTKFDEIKTSSDIEKKISTIGESLKKSRNDTLDKFDGYTSPFKKILAPFYAGSHVVSLSQSTVPSSTAAAGMSGFTSSFPDRDFFKSQFSQLGNKVETVSETVDSGNRERGRFEKIQIKWKELADRLKNRKERKNSYEDVQEQKARDKDKKEGFLKRGLGKVAEGAKGFAANLAEGNAIGAIGSLLTTIGGWVAGEALDLAGSGAKKVGGWALDKILGRGAGAAVAGGVAKRGLLGRAGSLFGRGAGATASLAGKGAVGALKGAGGLALKAGPGIVAGLAGGAIDNYFEKNTKGGVKRAGTTAGKALEYGSYGATIGSIIPGVGTVAGGAIGAGLGAIVANADLLSKAFEKTTQGISWIGSSAYDAAKGLWTGIFGQKAIVDKKTGKVKREEKQSVLGNIQSSFWGRDAKYSKSGEVIRPGKTGLVPYVTGGVTSFIFGKNYDPKKWENKSLLTGISENISEVFTDFKESMMGLPGKIMDGLSWLKDAGKGLVDKGANAASGVGGWISDKANQLYEALAPTKQGNVYKGGGTPVPDGPSVVSQLLPQATITSSYRPPSHPLSRKNPGSWHSKSKAAVDVKPVPGMTFEQFKKVFTDNGYKIIEAINEDNAGGGKQTAHATGNHWHIVLGQGTPKAGGSTFGTGTSPGVANWNKALSNQGGGSSLGSLAGTGGNYSSSMSGFSGGSSGGNYAAGMGGSLINKAGDSGGNRFAQTVNYLMSKNWSRTAAIGIAANLWGESDLNPQAHNEKGGGQGALGVAQWRGPRIRDIEAKWGKPILQMSLKEQLDAVDWEMRSGKHVTNEKAIPNGDAPFVSAINSASNWQSVVQQMVHRYERPGRNIGERNQETVRRVNIGAQFLSKMGTDSPQLTQKTSNEVSKPTQKAAVKQAAKSTPKTESHNPVVAGINTLNSTMGEMSKNLSAYARATPSTVAKPAKSGNSTVIAPVTIAAAAGGSGYSKPSTTMSMAKTSVRTGA